MFLWRRKKVRLHQIDPVPTVEGILTGKPWRCAGHYVIKQAGIMPGPDQTIPFDGVEVWVPRERVIFVEVLK